MTSRPFDDFFAGRRVLLTGHTGFKGAWLSLWLQHLGASVTGLSLPPEDGRPSLFTDAHVADGMDSQFGDIRDVAAVQRVVDTARPEIILHLAAQSLVRRSYRAPLETFSTNVMGTAHVLDSARNAANLQAVVVVTSDKCYDNREQSHRYREDEPMGGHDPYSASKGCAELVTSSYRRSFGGDDGARIASARAGNVIGGGDWAEDRLVPDLMRAAARGGSVALRCPQATRPWQHVFEPLRGYLMLARALCERAPNAASAWNFGPAPRDARRVSDVVAMLQRSWPAIRVHQETQSVDVHEAQLLELDASRAQRELGWSPILPLEDALQATADWYRRYFADAAGLADRVANDLRAYETRWIASAASSSAAAC